MSSAGRIYLDYNATTPLDPGARAAMAAALESLGGAAANPSSIHAEGRTSRDLVETARRQLASLLDTGPEQVVFTSGGTEADLIGLVGLYQLARAEERPPRVLVAATEHPAVWGAATHLAERGAEVVTLPVDARGVLDPDGLALALAGGAAVVAVALANHELGTLQDLPRVAEACRAVGARLLCDAVQAVARGPLEPEALGADAVALSGHKMHGPPGVGALWLQPGLDLAPLAPGGHQERGRRPGTENLVGIVGMGAAAEGLGDRAARAAERARLADLTGALERGLVAQGARIHGAGAARVPGTVNAGFAQAPGELVVQALDLAGIAASTGAACTSGTVSASPVLLALGLERTLALEGVRFSLGRATRPGDVEAVLAVLPEIVSRIRRFA